MYDRFNPIVINNGKQSLISDSGIVDLNMC